MIYTKFGGIVKIEKKFTEDWVIVRREDNSIRKYHISELKADGGLDEIEKSIAAIGD